MNHNMFLFMVCVAVAAAVPLMYSLDFFHLRHVRNTHTHTDDNNNIPLWVNMSIGVYTPQRTKCSPTHMNL